MLSLLQLALDRVLQLQTKSQKKNEVEMKLAIYIQQGKERHE